MFITKLFLAAISVVALSAQTAAPEPKALDNITVLDLVEKTELFVPMVKYQTLIGKIRINELQITMLERKIGNAITHCEFNQKLGLEGVGEELLKVIDLVLELNKQGRATGELVMSSRKENEALRDSLVGKNLTEKEKGAIVSYLETINEKLPKDIMSRDEPFSRRIKQLVESLK